MSDERRERLQTLYDVLIKGTEAVDPHWDRLAASSLVGDLLSEYPADDTCRLSRQELIAELKNLLARIHRDGGHYLAEHGWRKALDDADTVAAKAIVRPRADESRCSCQREPGDDGPLCGYCQADDLNKTRRNTTEAGQ